LLKTLAILDGTQTVRHNVSSRLSSLAGFEVTGYGRFWATAEADPSQYENWSCGKPNCFHRWHAIPLAWAIIACRKASRPQYTQRTRMRTRADRVSLSGSRSAYRRKAS
jgi:hypothetical protein